jgi:hypothetical protein
MTVTISRPVNGISANGDEYALDEAGELLEFGSVKEAVNFLADLNYTIKELRELDFNIEREGEEEARSFYE